MNSNSLVSQFSGADWDNQCVLSYGLSDEVPLDPSFPKASIQSVTANGSAVEDNDVLTGSQELIITGSYLSGRNVKLYFNNVLYTPLVAVDDHYNYLLTDNGSVRIVVNGETYMNLTVEGVTVPGELSGRVVAQLSDSEHHIYSPSWRETTGGCLNYNVKNSAEYNNVLVGLYFDEGESGSPDDIVLHNGEGTFEFETQYNRLIGYVQVIDLNSPVYLTYKGFIFFVGNY